MKPDFKTVLNFVWSAKKEWFNLGVQLNIGMEELQRINQKFCRESGSCLRGMVLTWLNMTDPAPSWEVLANALEGDSVDPYNSSYRARNIREIFNVPKKPSASCELCIVLCRCVIFWDITGPIDDSEMKPDLKTVLNFVWGAKEKWFNLGVQLNIGMEELQRINQKFCPESGSCLREMVLTWLNMTDPAPSWEVLATALEGYSVDSYKSSDGARNIREMYNVPKKPCELHTVLCRCIIFWRYLWSCR